MQKLADGHDTDVVSSPPMLRSRCVAAPHAGELAPGWCGAGDDPLHPVAAPISKMDTQAKHASRILLTCLVSTVRSSLFRDLLLKEEPLRGTEPGFLRSAAGPDHWACARTVFALGLLAAPWLLRRCGALAQSLLAPTRSA